MNDAHAYEMQVQIWKPNTWGVTASMAGLSGLAGLPAFYLLNSFLETGKPTAC
jgi:hypothetical protein